MKCAKCGTESHFESNNFCANCGALLSSVSDDNQSHGTPGLSWESPFFSEAPFSALYTTLIALLQHPRQTLSEIADKPHRSRKALLYAMIVGSIGMTASWGWTTLLAKSLSDLPLNEMLIDKSLSSPVTLIFSPFLLLFQLLFLTLYTGVLLKLFHSRKVSFRRTLRMICYAETPMVLQVIPVFGMIIASILWIYSFLTGIHYLYHISRIKLVFLLMLPVLLFLVLGIVIIVAALAGGIFSGSGILQQLPPIFRP